MLTMVLAFILMIWFHTLVTLKSPLMLTHLTFKGSHQESLAPWLIYVVVHVGDGTGVIANPAWGPGTNLRVRGWR